jgi:hypothetical protein
MVITMIGDVINSSGSKASNRKSSGVVIVYIVFITLALSVYHLMAEGEFSAILTLSAIFQCLAFSLLGIQALATDSVDGISAKSLALDALALACRLSSTTWLEGYLPSDSTGDYLYQTFDALSLAMVFWLLYHVLSVKRQTYDAEKDTMPTVPAALGCFVLALIFHGDLDDRPAFDTLWMCGLFVSAISVLPQLWMIGHSRSSVQALTSHFVAVMAFSRILSGTYMWHAHTEITCEPWFGNFQHAGYAILAAHVVHLLLLGDFAYFYVKNLATKWLNSPLQLPETFVV